MTPVPTATYRLQLRPDYPFAAAAEIVPYAASLGVSHLHLSPVLEATPGSAHGYDVTDHSRGRAELGGEQGLRALSRTARAHGLGLVLDIVPNHMAIGVAENAWWWDVLRNGPASAYAPFFDVDWDPPEPKLRNSVLMPVLGDHYGRELEAGRIRVEHQGGGRLPFRLAGWLSGASPQ
jgi:(1->4)-alpha-D-glucan 1-alpha-D-glucosylmutase